MVHAAAPPVVTNLVQLVGAPHHSQPLMRTPSERMEALCPAAHAWFTVLSSTIIMFHWCVFSRYGGFFFKYTCNSSKHAEGCYRVLKEGLAWLTSTIILPPACTSTLGRSCRERAVEHAEDLFGPHAEHSFGPRSGSDA